MKTIAGLLLLPVLAGCATPEDTEPKGPPVQVTVYREPSPRDSLFPMLFIIDGHPVFQLQPEEARSFELPAGDHRFGYELGVYSCSARVRLEPGKTAVYRLAQDRCLPVGARVCDCAGGRILRYRTQQCQNTDFTC